MVKVRANPENRVEDFENWVLIRDRNRWGLKLL